MKDGKNSTVHIKGVNLGHRRTQTGTDFHRQNINVDIIGFFHINMERRGINGD